jgi:hypothetical protein
MCLKAPEPLAPGIDRLLADTVPLGDRRHRLTECPGRC